MVMPIRSSRFIMSDDKYAVVVDNYLKPIFDSFLKNRFKQVERMRVLLASSECNEIAKEAHEMKGTCGGYEVVYLEELGKKIETSAKNSNLIELKLLIESYDVYLKKINVQFKS